MSSWSKDLFRVAAVIDAPLEFVYSWCTDFTTEDAKLTGGSYERRILERSDRRVVFEDLSSTPSGWVWIRNVVALDPPRRWHLEAISNTLDANADYRLDRLPDDRTRLVMTWRLRSGPLGTPVPPRGEIEPALAHVWDIYRLAIEREYGHPDKPVVSSEPTSL